jgi:hypothetical protein
LPAEPATAQITLIQRAPDESTGPPLTEERATLAFAARWPDLPAARELDPAAAAAMSKDYGKDLAAKDRLQLAVGTSRSGMPQSRAAAGLEPAFLASTLTLVLLLLTGVIWIRRSYFYSRLRLIAGKAWVGWSNFRTPRRQAAPGPTRDIQADLRELMRDLRRAGSPRPDEDVSSFAPAWRRTPPGRPVHTRFA